MKRALWVASGVSIGIALVLVLQSLFLPRRAVAPHLTRERLLSITRGIAGGDVVARIGYPLRIEPKGPTYIEPIGKVSQWPSGYSWVYASPDRFGGGLSVQVLVSGNQVSDVFVEYDDLAVYSTVDGLRAPGARKLEEVLP